MPYKTVKNYASDILSKKIPAGEPVRLACQRFNDDLKRGDLYFDNSAAERVEDFFKLLVHHTTGEYRGQNFILEPWQQFIIYNLFGWKYKDTGLRRYRIGYIEVARKNGKTFLAAAIALYLLVGDNENRAEIFSAATKLDQARLCFREASRIVRSSAELKKYINVLKNNLSVEETFSRFEPLGADYSSLDGLNIHGCVVDELHAHKSRELWDVLVTSTGSRRQSLIVAITTAGANPDPETSICYQIRQDCISILKGEAVDDSIFSYIATLDQGDDWRDESLWIKSNPNLDISVKRDDLQIEAKKAARTPSQLFPFLRYKMNVWTETSKTWLQADVWNACNIEKIDVKTLEGKKCFIGADLAKRGDTSSLVLYFPKQDGISINTVVPFIFLPSERLAYKEQQEKTPWRRWEQNKHIFTCPGAFIKAEYLADFIESLDSRFEILDFVYDKSYMSDLLPILIDMGWTDDPNNKFAPRYLVEIPQTFLGMHPCIQYLEELITTKSLNHGGHPVLAWMVSQVVLVENDTDLCRFSKRKSRSKIDAIVALSMVAYRAKVKGNISNKSVYATRGATIIEF
jgi:phage terminase large subunit-like protein